MGQKIHPFSFRLGVIRDWESRWYANRREYAKLLHGDIFMRKQINKRFSHAGIAKIEIEQASNRAKITIHTARPGIIIGKKGSEIELLRNDLERMTGKQIIVNIEEVKRPELSAQLVAESIANQLLRRISFRRAMKRTVQGSMKAGALGVKIRCSGRLGGSEMARQEWYREGRVPLHTLRADIDYGVAEAKTKYGQIGIKVWLFRGEIFERPVAQVKKD